MAEFSPADLARQLSKQRAMSPSEVIALGIAREFPSIVRTARALGMDLAAEVGFWLEAVGADRVKHWVQPETAPVVLLSEWENLKRTPTPNVLSSLVAEQRLGERASDLGPYFHSSGSSYPAELMNARWMSAAALKRRANSVPFFEQVVLARSCNLARRYYHSLRPFASGEDYGRGAADIEWEVSKLTATAARFNSATSEELIDALTYLQSRPSQLLDIRSAALQLEILTELYHSTGNFEYVVAAIRFSKSIAVPANDWPLWHISLAEVYLNLVENATENAKAQFLRIAFESLNRTLGYPIENVTLEIRGKLLRALARYCLDNPSVDARLHRVRLPYLLRIAGPLPPIVSASADYLVNSIKGGAERGQYQHREFLAELLSRLAPEKPKAVRVEMLRNAVRLRGAFESKGALEGRRDRMAQAVDYFTLYELEGRERDRFDAIDLLLQMHADDPSASEPLVLLARDLERSGPDLRLHSGRESGLVGAIRTGDHRALLARAAALAFSDQSLRISGLGGRGKTFTVSDFSGFAGDTFVFKVGVEENLVRDQSRAAAVERMIADAHLEGRFGVIEHIDRLEIERDDGAFEMVSVRRFARGDTLRAHLASLSQSSDRRAALLQTAEFLARIHWAVPATEQESNSVRAEIRDKELGRWLKRLVPREHVGAMFAQWWCMVRDVPRLPRRDAHTLNWIVSGDGRILAADLESRGARPALYELAQLVEDHPVFEPTDDVSRRSVLDAYLSASGWDEARAEFIYDACSAARAIGCLTDPDTRPELQDRAFRRLAHVAGRWRDGDGGESQLAVWVDRVLEAWRLKVGLADPTRFTAIAHGDRVRISKAMSYHLRHDPLAPVAPGGWIYAEDLAELLRSNGHKVTPDQLLVIAGALGEPRFELDKNEIRAAYGHSRVRHGEFEKAVAPEILYHATAARNLSSILSARSGILAQSRQYVHLASDPSKAEIAGRRHDARAVLLSIDSSRVPELFRAAPDTWLATAVPVEAVRIPTIAELWLRDAV